jgi:hypothetical protein
MAGRTLRDAVHKDIHLSGDEVAVIDTAQMQRLRGIRQLGAAYYVYPSAHHTRFEHCLGTLWMAKRIVSEVEAAQPDALPELEKQAVFLAALVHDVTHIPFGHTFEDERRLLERHDTSRSRHEILLGDSELGRLLRSSEAGRLALHVVSPSARPDPLRPYLRQIVSGTICADLLDYLKRDNYFCGLCYEFDERVFRYFRVIGGQLMLDLHQGGLFRHDALSEVTHLLRTRYVLSERVYYHHAKIAAGVMISKAIERAMRAGLREQDLCNLTDGGLTWHLRQGYGDDPALVELLDAFETRRLFKRCYMLSRSVGEQNVAALVSKHHFDEAGARNAAERRVAEALGIQEHRVAVYCAPAGMALKEADVPVTVPGGGSAPLSSFSSEEVQVLKRQHEALWRLYVFLSPAAADRTVEAGRVCDDVIGFPNELPAERMGRIG